MDSPPSALLCSDNVPNMTTTYYVIPNPWAVHYVLCFNCVGRNSLVFFALSLLSAASLSLSSGCLRSTLGAVSGIDFKFDQQLSEVPLQDRGANCINRGDLPSFRLLLQLMSKAALSLQLISTLLVNVRRSIAPPSLFLLLPHSSHN